MFNCSFCEEPIQKGTGLIYAKKDGTIFNFCSSKCKKNSLVLKREGRRQKWTEAARKFQARQASKKEQAAKEAKVAKTVEVHEKKERPGAKLAVPPGLKTGGAKPETPKPEAKKEEPKAEVKKPAAKPPEKAAEKPSVEKAEGKTPEKK